MRSFVPPLASRMVTANSSSHDERRSPSASQASIVKTPYCPTVPLLSPAPWTVQRDAVACVEATAGKDESGLGAKLRASPSPSAAAMDDDTRPAGSVRERKAAQELAFNF